MQIRRAQHRKEYGHTQTYTFWHSVFIRHDIYYDMWIYAQSCCERVWSRWVSVALFWKREFHVLWFRFELQSLCTHIHSFKYDDIHHAASMTYAGCPKQPLSTATRVPIEILEHTLLCRRTKSSRNTADDIIIHRLITVSKCMNISSNIWQNDCV